MRFSFAAIAALAASVCAQQRNSTPNNKFGAVTKPEGMEEVQTGTTYTIEWSVGAGFEDVLVNIILVGGKTVNTQVERTNITRGLPNAGSFEWEVELGLGGLEYNGIIVESAENPLVDYQYTERFLLVEDPSYSASSAAPSSAEPSTTGPVTVTSRVVITTTSAEPTATDASSSAEDDSTTASTTTDAPSSSAAPAESSPAESSPAESPEGGSARAQAGILAVFGGVALALAL